MGKSCHCGDHTPLDHFKVTPNSENDIVLTINGIEVPGAAGFLQAYHKQSERLIDERVQASLKRDFKYIRELLLKISDELENIKEFKTKKNIIPKLQELMDSIYKETFKDK